MLKEGILARVHSVTWRILDRNSFTNIKDSRQESNRKQQAIHSKRGDSSQNSLYKMEDAIQEFLYKHRGFQVGFPYGIEDSCLLEQKILDKNSVFKCISKLKASQKIAKMQGPPMQLKPEFLRNPQRFLGILRNFRIPKPLGRFWTSKVHNRTRLLHLRLGIPRDSQGFLGISQDSYRDSSGIERRDVVMNFQ